MRRLTLRGDPEAVVAELRQPVAPAADIERAVRAILDDVRTGGDGAVRAHARRLDGVELPERYGVSRDEVSAALAAAAPELRAALELAAVNIRAYHTREMPAPWRERLAQGQVVGQEIVPVGVAGLYVPGGLANYPSSVLMTAIPAQVAGVGRVVVCSPPRSGGGVAAGVAAACGLLGVADLYPIGGAQAVAAMAFGTSVVPRCDVIVGPGNAYVTEAKRQVMGEVRIDGLAGPSEVLIVADAGGRPEWLAADLLAQEEHGAGAMAALLDVGGKLCDRVADAVAQLAAELDLPTDRVAVVTCEDRAAALSLVNAFAPEHLELHVADAAALLPQVRNTGAVLHRAMQAIAAEGRGVILYLRREEHGGDVFGGADGQTQSRSEPSTNPATRLRDFRDYGIGAQILRDLGVGKIRLLTNYPRRLVSLPGYGLEIVECVPLSVDSPEPAPRDDSAKVAKLR